MPASKSRPNRTAQDGDSSIGEWLYVKDWRRTQHYRWRNPPWIKAYREDLDDDNYCSLSFQERGVLGDIRKLASKYGGKVPANLTWLCRRLGAEPGPNFHRAVAEIERRRFISRADIRGIVDNKEQAVGFASEPLAEEHPQRTENRAQRSRASSSSSVHSGNGQPRIGEPTTTTDEVDRFVAGVLGLGWSIDQETFTDTFNDCRASRPDCTVEELVQLARDVLSHCKKNAAGLLAKGLPKRVDGKPFLEFRAKRERDARAQEEDRRRQERNKRLAQQELEEYEAGRVRAQEALTALTEPERQSLHDRVKNDFIKSYPRRKMTAQMIEDQVQTLMLQSLRR